MTDEKYRPKSWPDALTRISEECSEVIKLVCKAQRFGLHDVHPKKGKQNIALIFDEMRDITTALHDFITLYDKATLPNGEGGCCKHLMKKG